MFMQLKTPLTSAPVEELQLGHCSQNVAALTNSNLIHCKKHTVLLLLFYRLGSWRQSCISASHSGNTDFKTRKR